MPSPIAVAKAYVTLKKEAAMSLLQIAYVSEARLPVDDAAREREIQKIRASAERHNSEHGISGYFGFDGKKFFQIIEGEPASTRGTLLRISGDYRHADIVILGERIIPKRDFEGWNMGFTDLKVVKDTEAGEAGFNHVKDILLRAATTQV
ncbi:MAG: BLUF domain-containing protein [Bosea sp. (in: a-proteobacteria)]